MHIKNLQQTVVNPLNRTVYVPAKFSIFSLTGNFFLQISNSPCSFDGVEQAGGFIAE